MLGLIKNSISLILKVQRGVTWCSEILFSSVRHAGALLKARTFLFVRVPLERQRAEQNKQNLNISVFSALGGE